jgi:hypothetical protein
VAASFAQINVKWQRYRRAMDRFYAARSNGAEEATLDYMKGQLDELYSSYAQTVSFVESVSPNPKLH